MRGGMWVAGLVFVGLILCGCVSQAKYIEMEKSYVERGEALARANAMLDEYHEKVNFLTFDLRGKESLLKKREGELALVTTVRKSMNKEFESGLVTALKMSIFRKDEGVSYDSKRGALILEGSVFFDSGSDKVKEGVKNTLLKIASLLKNRRGTIRIVGHTDSDPVRKTKDKWPSGNLQLSGARAMKVLLFLRDKGGVAGERMSFAGCGPHQPRVDNNSKQNKKQNRRVEIMVKELAE